MILNLLPFFACISITFGPLGLINMLLLIYFFRLSLSSPSADYGFVSAFKDASLKLVQMFLDAYVYTILMFFSCSSLCVLFPSESKSPLDHDRGLTLMERMVLQRNKSNVIAETLGVWSCKYIAWFSAMENVSVFLLSFPLNYNRWYPTETLWRFGSTSIPTLHQGHILTPNSKITYWSRLHLELKDFSTSNLSLWSQQPNFCNC